MVFFLSLFPPCLFSNPLGNAPRALTTIRITATFTFHSFFTSLARSRYLSIFSLFPISHYGQLEQHNPLDDKVFLGNQHKVWSSGRDLVIRLYLKIQKNFICLILTKSAGAVENTDYISVEG